MVQEASHPATRAALHPALVGREAERALLLDLWGESAAGRQTLVAIEGLAGVGKTALVRSLDAAIFAGGGRLLELRPNLDGTSTLLQLLTLLRTATGAHELPASEVTPAVARALGLDSAPANDALGLVDHRSHGFAEVAAFVERRLRVTGPVVLLLDDCWRLDSASVELLDQLSERPTAPLLIVACRRGSDAEASESVTPIEALLARAFCRIELAGLLPDAVGSWFARSFGRSDAVRRLAAACQAETEGNPLHLRILVERLLEQGALVPSVNSSDWSWGGLPLDGASEVAELLAQRLSHLDPECLDALRWGAASGLTFRVAGLPFGDPHVLSEATEIGLISLVDPEGGECRFHHERIRDAVLDAMPEDDLRRRRIAIGLAALASGDQAHGAALLMDDLAEIPLAALSEALGAVCAHAETLLAASDWEGARRITRGVEIAMGRLPAQVDARPLEVASLLARVAWLNGDMEESSRIARAGVGPGLVDTLSLRPLEIRALVARSEFEAAVRVGLACVLELGVRIPARPSKPRVLWMVLRLRSRLARAMRAGRLERPATDPRALIADEVLAVIAPAVTAANPELSAVCAATLVDFIVDHGPGPNAAFGLAGASLLCREVLGDWQIARAFGEQLAVLGATAPGPQARMRAGFLYEFYVRPSFGRVSEGTTRLRELAQEGVVAGEFEFAAYSEAIALFHDLMLGVSLTQIAEEAVATCRRIDQLGQRAAKVWFASSAWAICELAGRAAEAADFAREERDGLPDAPRWNWPFMRAMVHGVCGRLEQAAAEVVTAARIPLQPGTARIFFDPWVALLGHFDPQAPRSLDSRAARARTRRLARENPAEHQHRATLARVGHAAWRNRPREVIALLGTAAEEAEGAGARLELVLIHRLLSAWVGRHGAPGLAALHTREAERLASAMGVDAGLRPSPLEAPPARLSRGEESGAGSAIAAAIGEVLRRLAPSGGLEQAILLVLEGDGLYLRGDSETQLLDWAALRAEVDRWAVLVPPRLAWSAVRQVRQLSEPAAGGWMVAEPLCWEGSVLGVLALRSVEEPVSWSATTRATVGAAAQELAANLAVARLEARGLRLAQSYSRFVPNELLALLGKNDITELAPGDRVERELTVMFADVRGFTARSERLGPERSFAFVNELLAELEPTIRRHGGVVDKFMGDGLLALFPAGPTAALRAALSMVEAVRAHSFESGEVRLGVGVNHGPMVVGVVGSARRLDGTVLADSVNVASRIEGLTKPYSTSVLVSRSVRERCDPGLGWTFRRLPSRSLRGRLQPESLFELVDAEEEQVRQAKLGSRLQLAEAVLVWDRLGPGAAVLSLQRIVADWPADSTSRDLLFAAVEESSAEPEGSSSSSLSAGLPP